MKKNNERNESLKEDYKIMSMGELRKKYRLSRQRIEQIVRRKIIEKKLKILIRKRDNYTCQWCGKYSLTCEIHHVNLNPSDNGIKNLILLCKHCHLVFHKFYA